MTLRLGDSLSPPTSASTVGPVTERWGQRNKFQATPPDLDESLKLHCKELESGCSDAQIIGSKEYSGFNHPKYII